MTAASPETLTGTQQISLAPALPLRPSSQKPKTPIIKKKYQANPTWGTLYQIPNQYSSKLGLPRWFGGKEPTCQCRKLRRCGFHSWVRKIPWRRKWQPPLVFLPGKSHGQRSLVGDSPWRCKELDTAEHACTYARDLIIPQRNGLKAFPKCCLDIRERNRHSSASNCTY